MVDTIVTLLKHVSLPMTFWDFGVMMVVHLYNQNPSTVLDKKYSYEALIGNKLNYSAIQIFGSKCFPCLHNYRKSKLDDKSMAFVFLGYSSLNAGYIFYNMEDVGFTGYHIYGRQLLLE